MMKGKFRHVLYLALALSMLIIAIPRLELGQGWATSAIFAVVWTLFALLVIAANLHALLGIDAETKQELLKIRRAKQLMWQRELQRREFRRSKRA